MISVQIVSHADAVREKKITFAGLAQSSNITADSSILFARIERETSSRWRLSYVEVKPFIIVTKISWESTGKISAHKHWFVNKCAKHWNITRLCLVVSVTVECP